MVPFVLSSQIQIKPFRLLTTPREFSLFEFYFTRFKYLKTARNRKRIDLEQPGIVLEVKSLAN